MRGAYGLLIVMFASSFGAALASVGCSDDSSGAGGGGAGAVSSGSDCAACSDAAPTPCQFALAGDVSEVDTLDGGCSSLTPFDGGWTLAMQIAGASAKENVSIDLGATPSPGVYTSDNIQTWSVAGASTQGCVFSAGNESVPTGSFKLKLTRVDTDADASAAHGVIDAIQAVQAPVGSTCAPGDFEEVEIVF